MSQFIRKHWIALLISLALIVAVIFVFHSYTNDLEASQYQMVLRGAKEIALQQEKAIDTALQNGFDRLHDTAETIHLLRPDAMRDAQQLLNISAAVTDFDTMGLIDEDGTIYTDSYRTLKRQDILSQFEKSGGDFVVRFDNVSEQTGKPVDSLLFGCRHEMTIGGKKIVGIFGRVLRSKLNSLLQSNIFNGDGYTAVLDPEGRYLATYEGSVGAFETLSIYDEMLNWDSLSIEDENRLRICLKKKTSCNFSYTVGGAKRIGLVYPLENAESSILVVIPYDMFGAVVADFTEETKLLFAFIAVCFIAIGVYAVYHARRSATARAAMNARSGFLSAMSHEIRTPLNGIIGLIRLISDHLDDREKLEEYTVKMSETSQYLLSLINDILDVSKLEEGHVEPELSPVSLEVMMDGIYSQQAAVMDAGGISFSVNRQIRFPYVLTDAMRLQQILNNLISNAAKYTPSGGQVRVEISQLRVDSATAMTKFVIADTGIGMSDELLEHIFDPNAQENSADRVSGKGTGLGMAISQKLTQALHGEIKVESEVNKGSIFTVTVPTRITSRNALIETSLADPIDRPLDKKLRVLVAEDNELNAEILMEILADAGIAADRAGDGSEAVEMFRKSAPNTYDVILMDIQMPVMDGYEATRRIRRLLRDDADTVKIFACTANSFKEDRDEAFAAGMNDFIIKPVDIGKLFMKLRAESDRND